MVKVSDLIPQASGTASLGVNQSNLTGFDITTIAPFSHVHMNSGVWHDISGQSGILRYSRAASAMQVSVDGGLTFNNLITAGGVTTSVGVIGGANLTGDVDLSPTTSGFIVIGDTAGASPVTFSVDVWALSGLFKFPAAGFNSNTMPRCFAATFGSATTWTVTHNLGTADVSVDAYDAQSPRQAILPDTVSITDINTVTITFNVAQAGRAIIFAC